MKIKSERDFWSGLMFIVIGVVFAIGAGHYPMGTSAKPGAGYFPIILSVILALLGAVVLFKSLTFEADGGDRIGVIAWRPLLVVVASIALFGLALPRLGMFITIPLVVLLVSFAGGDFRWKGVLVNCVVLTVGSWAVFIQGLALTIPLKPAFLG
ncbi:MAG: tripartite tricarboxylate transporter TctB family protein [Proteobacteria bacterium]|nr:tripartite tricarboxylate transporter TctB family protein [Pseudomonadota bacterium]